MEERGLGPEELTVRVYGAWKAVGEPVEGDGVQDLVQGWRLVGPLEEFLTYPAVAVKQDQVIICGVIWLTYQASNATGLDESTRPIVEGLVPCSRA